MATGPLNQRRLPALALEFGTAAVVVHRRDGEGWRELGAVPLAQEDFAAAVEALRAQGVAETGSADALLWLPPEHVLAIRVSGEDAATARAAAQEALSERLGVAAAALATRLGPRGPDGSWAVAAADRDTVAEAAAYARRWGFEPTGVSARSAAGFETPPLFDADEATATEPALSAEAREAERKRRGATGRARTQRPMDRASATVAATAASPEPAADAGTPEPPRAAGGAAPTVASAAPVPVIRPPRAFEETPEPAAPTPPRVRLRTIAAAVAVAAALAAAAAFWLRTPAPPSAGSPAQESVAGTAPRPDLSSASGEETVAAASSRAAAPAPAPAPALLAEPGDDDAAPRAAGVDAAPEVGVGPAGSAPPPADPLVSGAREATGFALAIATPAPPAAAPPPGPDEAAPVAPAAAPPPEAATGAFEPPPTTGPDARPHADAAPDIGAVLPPPTLTGLVAPPEEPDPAPEWPGTAEKVGEDAGPAAVAAPASEPPSDVASTTFGTGGAETATPGDASPPAPVTSQTPAGPAPEAATLADAATALDGTAPASSEGGSIGATPVEAAASGASVATVEPGPGAPAGAPSPVSRPAAVTARAAVAPTAMAADRAPRPRARPGRDQSRRDEPEEDEEPRVSTGGAREAGRRATLADAMSFEETALVGVFGGRTRPQALVRLPTGEIRRVKVGDRVESWTVIEIGSDFLRMRNGQDNRRLQVPGRR